MTIETIANSIRSRFGTTVEDVESVTVHYDNEPFESPGDSAWIRCHIVFGEAVRRSLGSSSSRYRSVGVMMANIYTPIGKGDKAGLAIAETVRDAFRSVTADGISYRVPSVIPVGRSDNGKWWQINVNCPFYFDELV